MARKNRKQSTTRRLHRWIGVGTSVFVLFMALSGLAINHSGVLNLAQKHVDHPGLREWYGLAEPVRIQSFAANERWLSFAGSRLYLDGELVANASEGVGAVFDGEKFVAAGKNEILLIDLHGRLIEKQAWDQPGAGMIESIGLNQNKTVVINSAGALWSADPELLSWQPLSDTAAVPLWSSSGSAPEAVQQVVARHYRGAGLSLERVLLDLHSGRIFGHAGVLVYDLLALFTGFLAISGLILWVRVLNKKNGKNHKARSTKNVP